MRILPTNTLARVFLILGVSALLFSISAQIRMWQAEFGLRPVAAGGGEYLMALLFALPSLLLATIVLGISTIKQNWRSTTGTAAFAFCLFILLGWLVASVIDAV